MPSRGPGCRAAGPDAERIFTDAGVSARARWIGGDFFSELPSGGDVYLLKSVLRKELPEAIRLVHAGHKKILPEVATELAEHAADEALSPREIEVLGLIARGNANKVIASQLSITEETVKGHVKNILAKLSANDRTHAVTIGLRRGIIGL